MDQENKTNQGETKQEITPASAPEDAVPPEKKPYSKKARAWADHHVLLLFLFRPDLALVRGVRL